MKKLSKTEFWAGVTAGIAALAILAVTMLLETFGPSGGQRLLERAGIVPVGLVAVGLIAVLILATAVFVGAEEARDEIA